MTGIRLGSRQPVPAHLVGTGILTLLAAWLVPAVGWAAGGEGGAGLIELNATLLVQVVNFVVLLVVLYAVAYKPLMGTLRARSAAIAQQLAEAQAAREQAERQLAEFQTRLQAAHAEAQAAREQALREAAETRERLTQEARTEAARLVEAARAEIGEDVRRARAELRREVGTLAVTIAERVIQRSLGAEDHQRLIDDALTRLESS
jgi:F-type H+-transporting ATPase subunit b